MKNLLIGLIGIAGLSAMLLQITGPASAQQPPDQFKHVLQAAPKGGIVMLQDEDSVYVYDGGLRKLMIVSKRAWDDKGKPMSNVVKMD